MPPLHSRRFSHIDAEQCDNRGDRLDLQDEFPVDSRTTGQPDSETHSALRKEEKRFRRMIASIAESYVPIPLMPAEPLKHEVVKPSRWLHVFPCLTDFAFLLPVIIILRLGGLSVLLGDGDTGWHLRTGEWILRNRRVPTTDLFSYTRPGEQWFAWEWLWDVVFGWIHLSFGLTAVLLGSLLLLCLTSALVYRSAKRAASNPLIAAAIALIGAVASSVHWLARPHLVTLLFVVIFCMLLECASQTDPRALIFLPLLTIFWANFHGGFFIGVVLIGAYAAGELCVWLIEPAGGQRGRAPLRCGRYTIAAIACSLASLVNPYGYKLHAHIFRYFSETYHLKHISEFQSLDFHHPAAPFFAWLLMMAAAAAFWHLAKRRYTWSLLLVGFGWLALVAARNIPIFVICAAAPIAAAAQEMLDCAANARIAPWLQRLTSAFREIAIDAAALERPWRFYLAGIGGFVLLAALCLAANPSEPFQGRFNPRQFPVRAVDSKTALSASSRIFTIDTWGGYLLYRLYPRIRVFIDGRSDFYGPEFGEAYLRIFRAQHDWKIQLNKFGVDTVLVPVDAPLAGALKESIHWRPVYDDGTAIVFRALNASTIPASEAQTGFESHRDRAIAQPFHPQPKLPNRKD